ncbi:MAG: DUF429 domain-containing protein [Halobacteriaceae archaeon]
MVRPPDRVYGIDLGVGRADAGRRTWVTAAVPVEGGVRVEHCGPATAVLDAAPDRPATLRALREFVRDRDGGAAVGLDCPFGLPADLATRLVGAVDWQTFLTAFPRQFAGPDDLEAACTAWARTRGDRTYRLRRSEAAFGAQCAYGFVGKHLTYHGIAGLLEPLRADAAALPMDLPGAASRDGPPARPLLLETYPAGALAARGLPSEGYKTDTDAARERRARCLDGLPAVLPEPVRETVRDDAGGDALDSVVAAAVAARATRSREAALPDDLPRRDWALEGYVYTQTDGLKEK